MSVSRHRSRYAVATATLALTAGAVLAAFGVGTSGATTKASAARPANKIVVLVYGDAQNKVEQWAVDTYNKTPMGKKVKAVLQTIPGANYQTKLQTIMGSSNAPDVFFNWGGGSIVQFQKAGLLLPLNGFMKADPKLKSSFLPSILDAAKIGNNYYGIPMRGTQPVMLFYNKTLLAQHHLTPPKTWAQLLSDVAALKNAGVQVPIALGGADQWPTLMWFEYAYDRVAGPSLVTDALNGKSSVWKTPGSTKALGYLKQLIDAGAFGPSKSWDSVYFTKNQTAQMLIGGQAAFELMGSWYYSTVQSQSASFAAKELGYTAFPSIPGGKGNLDDLAGNTENYYSVLKNTRYPQAVAAFLKVMYSPAFVKQELALGNLTTTTNTPKLISGPTAPYLKYQFNLIKKAPAFQLSWDQAWPQTNTNTIHTAVGDFFDNLDAGGFQSAMTGLQPAG
ncbi:MAG TPA: extracellular solute-binding protein [Gaiellaceae bacterium]|nr:extracellular solute-binding protein [Gaiellaceae bacterium]